MFSIPIKHPSRHVDIFRWIPLCNFMNASEPSFQNISTTKGCGCFSFFLHSLYDILHCVMLHCYLHSFLITCQLRPMQSEQNIEKHSPERKLAAHHNKTIRSRCSPCMARTLRTLHTSRRKTSTCYDRPTRCLDVRLIQISKSGIRKVCNLTDYV